MNSKYIPLKAQQIELMKQAMRKARKRAALKLPSEPLELPTETPLSTANTEGGESK